MAMSQATLESGLANMAPTVTEADAIAALVAAYRAYAAAAVSNGIPVTSVALTAGAAAMSPTLAGMSATGAGLTKVPNAVIAFWAAIAATPAAFTSSIAVTPPPHATVVAQFPLVCASNTTGNKSKADSLAAIAGLLHTNAITGGTATFPGPTTFPIL